MSESNNSQTTPAGRNNVAVLIVMIVIAITILATVIPIYHLKSLSGETTEVFNIEVDVVSKGGNEFISNFRPRVLEMDLIDAPRKDNIVLPGISVTVLRGEEMVGYKSFVEFYGPGTYNLTVAMKIDPREAEAFTISVVIFPEELDGHMGDNKDFTFLWTQQRGGPGSLAIDVETNATASPIITNASASKAGPTQVGTEIVYPSLMAYVMYEGRVVSQTGVASYAGTGSYRMIVPVLGDVPAGAQVKIVIQLWRLGDNLREEEQRLDYIW